MYVITHKFSNYEFNNSSLIKVNYSFLIKVNYSFLIKNLFGQEYIWIISFFRFKNLLKLSVFFFFLFERYKSRFDKSI